MLSVGSKRLGEPVKSLPEAGDASECLGKVYEDQRDVLWAGSEVLKMSEPGEGTKVVFLCGVVGLWCLVFD